MLLRRWTSRIESERHGPKSYDPGRPLRQSVIGLNATNFFLAEVLGVVMPFLAKFLAERRWRDDAVGLALATAGLGVFLMQTPAGFIVDRVRQRRALVVVASITLGLCYGLLPLVPAKWWTLDPLLFVSGMAVRLAPVLGALALGLAGHAALNRTMGSNQAWNHAGNIAAALTAMVIVGWWGIASVFYAVLVVSLAAAGSDLLHSPMDSRRTRSGIRATMTDAKSQSDSRELIATVRWRSCSPRRPCFISPTAAGRCRWSGLYVARPGGTIGKMAAVVLVAQTVMIPVALGDGLAVRPLGPQADFRDPFPRFAATDLSVFADEKSVDPGVFHRLDGIGAGVYGVAVVAMWPI